MRLADRIARNREILGLHYRSDSKAGKELAEKTVAIFKNCPTVTPVDSLWLRRSGSNTQPDPGARGAT